MVHEQTSTPEDSKGNNRMKRLLLIAILAFLSGTTTILAQGKISAYAYLDYLYNVERDPSIGAFSDVALDGQKAFQSFQFRRIYLTYDNVISQRFSGRFRLEADESALSSDGKNSVFVKDAYIRWKEIFEGQDLIAGIQPTPAFQVSEEWWGYRSLEKTILDLRGIVSSRDFGLSMKGKFDQQGAMRYQFMFANGSGNRPEGDKYKRYYANLHFNPSSDIQINLYGDFRARGDIRNMYAPDPTSMVSNNSLTYAVFAGYRIDEAVSVGVEGFLSSTENGFDTNSALEERTAAGLSLFGSWNIGSGLSLVGRYDYFDPNTSDLSAGDARSYVLCALDRNIDEHVSIMPNVQVETYESVPGRSFDPSITTRVTFQLRILSDQISA